MGRILAVLGRELRAYFDSVIAYVILLAFFLFVTWSTLGTLNASGVATLRGFFDMLPLAFLFFIPALGGRLWSEEKKLGTIELLLTWPLQGWDIVLGKFFAGLTLIAVAIAMTGALGVFVGVYGEPDLGPMITGYIAALLLGGAYLALACFVSSLTENQILAFVASAFASTVLYLAGSPAVLSEIPPQVELAGVEVGTLWLVDALGAVGFGARFASVSRGVLDLGDVVFYLGTIALFLYLNVRSVAWIGSRAGSGSAPWRDLCVGMLAFVGVALLFSGRWLAGPFCLAALGSLVLTGASEASRAWRLRLADNALAAALAAVIAVQGTALADRAGWRVDLTEEGVYSLSETSRELVGRLEDPLEVRCYFSGRLPPLFEQRRQQAVDILEEFATSAKGQMNLRFFDPETDPEAAEAAKQVGVAPTTVTIRQGAEMQRVQRTFGCVLEYRGQTEVFPFMPDIGALESELAGAIRKLDAMKPVRMAIFQNREAPSGGVAQLRLELTKRRLSAGTVAWDALAKGQPIPDSTDILLVIAPEQLSEREAYEIDQFVMKGGDLVLLADGVAVDLNKVRARPVVTGLEDVLNAWGFEILPQLVRERDPARSELIRFNANNQVIEGPSPFAVRIPEDRISREHPITATIPSLSVNEASPIRIRAPAERVTVLAKASPTAFGTEELGNLARRLLDFVQKGPQARPTKGDEVTEPVIAVAYEGPLTSAFRGRTPPPIEGTLEASAADAQRKTVDARESGRIVIIGDAALIEPETWRPYPQRGGAGLVGGLTLVLNTIDWLAGDADLIALRNRGLEPRLLSFPEGQSAFRRHLPLYLVPTLLLLALGLTRWAFNRQRASRIGAELERLAQELPALGSTRDVPARAPAMKDRGEADAPAPAPPVVATAELAPAEPEPPPAESEPEAPATAPQATATQPDAAEPEDSGAGGKRKKKRKKRGRKG